MQPNRHPAAPPAARAGLALPPALAGWLGPARRRLLGEFLRFGAVGTLGFVVDAGVLTGAIALGLGPWIGRLLSFLAAASTTYALNRAWTFRHRAGEAGAGQWARFLLVNLVGFAANFGTYAVLLVSSGLVAAWPVLGVAAGAVAGLAANFALSRRLVFNAGSGGKGRR
jgi:putative flippase GtrA